MPPRHIAFQMDAPEGLNTASDSTLALMEEAQLRGDICYYYAPESLSWQYGAVRAHASRMHLSLGSTPWFTLDKAITLDLATMDAVLIRQDPPFDMHYITATYLLEMLPKHVHVLNPPAVLRNAPEKLSVLEFAAYLPATLITENVQAIRDFVAQQPAVVAKPLYGFGGHGVYVFRAGDPNIETFLEQWNMARGGALVWQAFLPDVANQECRILFIDGKVASSFARLPVEGSIRSNMRVGGTPAAHTLSAVQQKCCDAVGKWLKANNVMIAGVDMIGDALIEINITSPTGLRAAQSLYGNNLARVFWDSVWDTAGK